MPRDKQVHQIGRQRWTAAALAEKKGISLKGAYGRLAGYRQGKLTVRQALKVGKRKPPGRPKGSCSGGNTEWRAIGQ